MRIDVPFELEAWTTALRQAIVARVEEALARRDRELTSELARLSEIKKKGDSDRKAIQDAATANLGRLDTLSGNAATLRLAITTGATIRVPGQAQVPATSAIA
jgi:hypothetical protein